jgi:hypothetical protein
MNFIERRVKVFLEAYNLRHGELDEKASCYACGRDLVKGKFDMIDGVLVCLDCKNEKNRLVSLAIDCEYPDGAVS